MLKTLPLFTFIGMIIALGILLFSNPPVKEKKEVDHKGAFTASLDSLFPKKPQTDYILHLQLKGVIARSSGINDPIYTLLKQIRNARKEKAIKAVLLSIDSPGGTVAASEQIYNAIMKLRKEKPVICVIEGIGASGGYLAASACTRIFAIRSAMIGSIGVISYNLNIHLLSNKLGFKMNIIKAGKYKDLGSPFAPFEEEQEQMLQEMVDRHHRQFVRFVAKGRKKTTTTIWGWADARVFSGRQAKYIGMIDQIGDVPEATAYLHKKLKKEFPVNAPVPHFIDELKDMLGPLGSSASSKFFLQNMFYQPALYLYDPSSLILQQLLKLQVK